MARRCCFRSVAGRFVRASFRISRCSASADRPWRAARERKAFTMALSMFLTISCAMLAMIAFHLSWPAFRHYSAAMPKAIVVHQTGGPEELRTEDLPEPQPGPGEARVRHTAIGVNYIDVYFRRGVYKAPAMPFTPGQEGAGVVEAVGAGVTEVAVGDRVAYAGLPGAYAEARVVPAGRLVKLPPGVDDKSAAAMMLKGMTAEVLLLRCARVSRGDTILFHAAAGGVGSIACQWAKHLGLRVIGTAGGPAKAARAAALGCDHVIDYDKEDIVGRVKELTGGAGVTTVFDGVGKRTFDASL